MEVQKQKQGGERENYQKYNEKNIFWEYWTAYDMEE